MYDRHLETFLQVADCGSFLKAAEKLYISANAVTKQINLLEDRLELKLFRRSTQGLELTEAGKLIYAEAKKMIRHANTVHRRGRELERAQEAVIRVGVSLMNPPKLLLEYWGRVSDAYPNLKLEVIPFEDTASAFSEVLDHLGEKIDLIPCPYRTDYWGDRYQSFHLCNLPLRVACAQTHPLAAKKESLTLADLRGQVILLTRKGEGTDELARLLNSTGDIQVERVDYYDFNTFNRVVTSNLLIASADCWSEVHPMLATLLVDWDFTVPYGLIYAKDPPRRVLEFLMAVGGAMEPGE